MKHGAVAMIDALGFKGIWRRYSSEEVMANLLHLKAQIEREHHGLADMTDPPFEFDAAFLSDTIVVGLSLPANTRPDQDFHSIDIVCDRLTHILKLSARSSTPLTYRGAVTFGPYEVESNFIIGEAIDEVAGYYEKAQAAVVWLLPAAKDIVANWLLGGNVRRTELVRFDVPLKGGDSFEV